jgi:hypothetical protein
MKMYALLVLHPCSSCFTPVSLAGVIGLCWWVAAQSVLHQTSIAPKYAKKHCKWKFFVLHWRNTVGIRISDKSGIRMVHFYWNRASAFWTIKKLDDLSGFRMVWQSFCFNHSKTRQICLLLKWSAKLDHFIHRIRS